VCHRTFGGVTGFDEHRRGDACLDPATLGYEERFGDPTMPGLWRKPMPLEVLHGRSEAGRMEGTDA
jgi:hypothetical protein